MTLQQFNSTILESLIYEHNEEKALRFWNELGSPDSIPCGKKLREFITIKQAILENSMLTALEKLGQLELEDCFSDLRFKLSLGHLLYLIENKTDTLKIIDYARKSVAPQVGTMETRRAAERKAMLNMVMSQMVFGTSGVSPTNTNLKWVCTLPGLQYRIINDIRNALFFANESEPPKLARIVGLYQTLDESSLHTAVN